MEVPPEMLGFEKTKVGPGEKETGYKIGGGRLKALLLGTLIIIVGVSIVAFGYFFEIRVERKSFLKELAKHERKAAHALVATELKLWSEYQSSIHSSWNAKSVYAKIKNKYAKFPDLLKGIIAKESSDLNIPGTKGEALTEKVLEFTNTYRKETLSLVEELVNHLVEQAKDDAKREHELTAHLREDLKEDVDPEEPVLDDLETNLFDWIKKGGSFSDPVTRIVDDVMTRWREEKATVSAMQQNPKLVEIKKELQRLHVELMSEDDERSQKALDEISARDWLPLSPPEHEEEYEWVESNLAMLQIDVHAMTQLEEELAAKSIEPQEALEQIMQMGNETKLPEQWLETIFENEPLPELGSEDEEDGEPGVGDETP